MAAHATLVPVAAGCPVRFGDVTVLPDDWVLADEDGILVLPLSLVERLIERHAAASVKERFSRQLLLSGFALTEVFPLPTALEPYLESFAATGTVPAAGTVCQAIGVSATDRSSKGPRP